MKKGKKSRKLSRKKDQRKALLKSLVGSLILKEKIKTTKAKAKEIARFVEKFITIAKSIYRTELAPIQAKKGGLVSRRLLSKFFSEKVVKKLVNDLGPRYKERKGGYTRIIKLGQRKLDGAKMAIIELVK